MKNRFLILFALMASWTGQAIAQTTQTPNDPLYNLQWGFNNTGQVPKWNNPSQTSGISGADSKVKDAWAITTGSANVTIAILDAGMQLDHPDFSLNRLWRNSGEIVNNGQDDDGNGYVDDIQGWNFVNSTPSIGVNPGRHGVGMTGVVAATANNNEGIVGVDWKAKIMVLRVVDDGEKVDPLQAAAAIRYAAKNGADIISMSFGWRLGFQPRCEAGPMCEFTVVERDAVEAAVDYADSLGVIMFASNGNDDGTLPEYPGKFAKVIAMGAASPCLTRKKGSFTGGPSCEGDERPEFPELTPIWGSNYGPHTDLLAPGTQLPSIDITGPAGFSASTSFFTSYQNGDYVKDMYGTSIASPFAAGVAGLMLAAEPSLTNEDIACILKTTARDLGPSGVDNESGYGLIDAYAAVLAAQNWNTTLPSTVVVQSQNITTNKTYQASNTIQMGPTVNITQAVHVNMVAGNSITFKPNFTMVAGATLEARLDASQSGGCSLNKTSPVAEEASSPEAALEQATLESYPNPFSQATTLRFVLPERSHAVLQVFNMQGLLVGTLFDGDAGAQAVIEAELRGEDLPAGIYMARLTTPNGVTLTRRLLLQK